jgi:D-alanine--poly(phosphoribitol) ligase subunit 2
MILTAHEIETAIKAKLVEIADKLDADARTVDAEDIIPATGVLDSAGIFELIAWYDRTYDLALREEEITIDNLGSLRRMTDYVLKRKSAR